MPPDLTTEQRLALIDRLEQQEAGRRRTAVLAAWGSAGVAALVLAALLFGGWAYVARERRVEAVRDRAVEQALETKKQEATAATTQVKKLNEVIAPRLEAWGTPRQAAAQVDPAELDARLKADAKLQEMPIADSCRGVAVNFYAPSAPDADTQRVLIGIWRNLGFRVEEVPFGIRQPLNAVWRGPDVPATCWRAIACTLIRAGIPVRDVGRPQKDVEKKRRSIDVGYSGPARLNPPLTLAALWSMK